MPQSYRIDTAQRVIWSRSWGVLSDADITDHQAALRADPFFDPTFNVLVDTSEVTEAALSLATVRALGHSSLFTPASRRAYVVQDEVIYGFVRMYELYQELRGAGNVRVFRDRAVAAAWLDVSDPANPAGGEASPIT